MVATVVATVPVSGVSSALRLFFKKCVFAPQVQLSYSILSKSSYNKTVLDWVKGAGRKPPSVAVLCLGLHDGLNISLVNTSVSGHLYQT